MPIPGQAVGAELKWLFPELDITSLDVARDRDFVLGRVLERGRLVDVRWALAQYGARAVHQFLQTSGSSELSPRTLSFWRAYFKAWDEPWKTPPDFRQNNAVHWPR